MRLLLRRRLLDIDKRAEHLEIGDQRVHFGHAGGVAVEIAHLRLGIARDEIARARIGIGLRADVVVRLADILCGLGNADARERGQVARHVARLEIAIGEEGVAGHD